jgi:hypothetical protein
MPQTSLSTAVVRAAAAGVLAALAVAVFAAGYYVGYASAWHELHIQPAIFVRSAN